ncbi:hypothetical protein P8C59_004321 [Phyllachora maydis]|uniref:BZIP transcription factor n=1 Tax=Phyllachora maydis TaxID=1825666 RepID=A0AAD9MB67_9PEZI|nr:hypothetical protein P8C59_004321 [Phyllachora maydis]
MASAADTSSAPSSSSKRLHPDPAPAAAAAASTPPEVDNHGPAAAAAAAASATATNGHAHAPDDALRQGRHQSTVLLPTSRRTSVAHSPSDSSYQYSPPRPRDHHHYHHHHHHHQHGADDPGPDNDYGDALPGKKRKVGPGSRVVANLTEEQRNKKRANDREAQRAIRERQKAKVEGLERRIAELESTHSYGELQSAVRQREAVDAENAELKRALASIVAVIDPLLNRAPAERPVYPSPGPSYLGHQAPQPQPPASSLSLNNLSTSASAASPGSVGAHVHQQRHKMEHGLELGIDKKLGLDFILEPGNRLTRIQSSTHGAQDTPPSYWRRDSAQQEGLDTTTPRRPSHAAVNSGHAALHSPHGLAADGNLPGTAGPLPQIRNCAATCPFDTLLLGLLQERRQRAAEGAPASEVLGPRYPSVLSLLKPSHSRFSHPLSKFFTDMLLTFPDLSGLPERVAVLYLMFLTMRWQICPSPENLARLPAWAQPLPEQFTRAHPAWLDHLPFPLMRLRLVVDYGYDPAGAGPADFPFDNFWLPYTSTLSLNWPYEETDTLLLLALGSDGSGEELIINPVFERHLRRLENWTLGDAFDRAFPALAGTYNLNRDGPRDGAAADEGAGRGRA